MKQTASILIMAGGTGGHIYPALAVAEQLREQGVEVRWLGTRAGLEAEVVPKANIAIDYINISGVRGKGLLRKLSMPFTLLSAMWQAWKILRQRNPSAVLGMGGFVTGPAGLVAALTGRKLLVHEQNAVPGMTNRWLARWADKVMAAFPGVLPRSELTGNPIRGEILNLAAPAERFQARQGQPLHLLVLGGSLGAKALNDVLPAALALLSGENEYEVWHQTGKRNISTAKDGYQQAGVNGRIEAYIDDMAAAYGWADLVICRAGALTISELACAGIGSILVPYPYAVDDHQTKNAAYLVAHAAATVVSQNELKAEQLAEMIKQYLHLNNGRTELLKMAEAARALGKPGATLTVANRCLEVANNGA
ncbi:MAG: undecaprenyldiphospho-muramoylpentapeptide beta-N-acetylglucosaminyltransferase [Gammaproteobacteria bacterium]|nr:undecaprenyldiphospho-muramoylpentapeptide beta-N-acetylglucosaminyltransferase [Gammaproteobacteria bacterium]MCF6229747.1 undecaprenyldiphospho-muramoylpentapeptide beta-N-acetylglucosaminyltransferase [Gammaproteobacteria bacterium]